MNNDEIIIGELKGTLESVKDSVSKIEKMLLGNGQPGLVERITRIEENLNSLSETMDTNTENITERIEQLVGAVEKLSETTDKHINDKDLHSAKGLLLKKDVLPYMIGGVILIVTILPKQVDLFELVKGLFGL